MLPATRGALCLHPEKWEFTAQNVMEKLVKCWVVLADGEPPSSHALDLLLLPHEANLDMADLLSDLQPFAVEASHQIGDFKRHGNRARILEEDQLLANKLCSAIATQAKD